MASRDLKDLHLHVAKVRALASAADTEWFSLVEMAREWSADPDTRHEQFNLASMLHTCVVEHLEKIEAEIEDLLRRGFRPWAADTAVALPPRAGG